jgi:adenine-specific DNA-methyltransferase
MMYPRLFLARQLLREDGVIFVSIDDNEVHHLRLVMNEIFGEENFVASFVWQKKYSRDNRPAIGTVHEYLVLFAKAIERFAEVRGLLPPDEESLKVYRNPNDDPRGRWRPVPLTAQAGHATESQFYEIVSPSGVVHTPPEGRCWAVSQETYERLLEEGRIWFGKDGTAQPNVIRYLSEIDGFVPWTWWPCDEVGHTDQAKKEIYSLLGRDEAFETPKPVDLIKRVLRISTASEEGAVVLDFFAGSATTAQAVLELNQEDGGNRQFIMVQIPEEVPAARFSTIADVGKERIRRVITRTREGDDGGQLALDLRPDEDLGFKVFKLAPSTFRQWEPPEGDGAEALGEQLALFDRGLEEGADPRHVIYEVILKLGYNLNAAIEPLELEGNRVFKVTDEMVPGTSPREASEATDAGVPGTSQPSHFFICLDDQLHDATIEALPLDNETAFVCLDTALDDSQKVNLAMQCLLKVI